MQGGRRRRRGVAADRPPLIHAAERGDLAELEALFAAGADMEARDEEYGSTAFHYACAREQQIGGSGGSLEPLGFFLNPLGLFLRTSIPFIWRILSAFLPA